jgi:hypothetical protein
LNLFKPWEAEGMSRATWFRRQKADSPVDGRTREAKRNEPATFNHMVKRAAPAPSKTLLAKANRARIAAQRDYDGPDGRGCTIAETIAAGERAAARVLASASPARPPEPIRTAPVQAPSRAVAIVPQPIYGEVIPPRSMIADGGRPPSRYAQSASIAEATALIRANAAQQAAVNAELSRRIEAIERREAATAARLKVIEDKRTNVVAIVQGFASMFSLV